MVEPITPPEAGPTLESTLARLGAQMESPEALRTPNIEAEYANLPVQLARDEIKRVLERDDTVIVVGGTGSGKTTQIPKMILETLGPGERMAVTQPRKFATERTASRVAEEMGVQIGELVGYQHRDAKKVGPQTRMIFTVEGTLLRKLQQDITLPDFAAVMVDEVHERSVNGDILLALLRKAQEARRQKGMPPLKIVATSATLEKDKLEKYLSLEGKTVEVAGTSPHTITESDEKITDPKKDPIAWDQMPGAAAAKALEILERTTDGNFAIFMPGKAWITQTIRELNKAIKASGKEFDIEILPLHGGLTPEEQNKINENPGKRKIVVTSPVLETSVTMKGLKYVIDSGLVSEKRLDPQTNVERLMVVKNAQKRNMQRRGRVGRIVSSTPDEYHALYDKNDHLLPEEDPRKRAEYQEPEILRSNLAHVVLSLKKTGINDVRGFEFMTKPSDAQMEHAHAELKRLGALDENEQLTELGLLMAEFPVNPDAAKLIIMGAQYECGQEACTMAAIMENANILPQTVERASELQALFAEYGKDGNENSDFLTMLSIYDDWQAHKNDLEWLAKPPQSALNFLALAEVEEVRDELVGIAKENKIPVEKAPDSQAIVKAAASVFADNLFVNSDPQRGTYSHVEDPRFQVKLGHDSILYGAKKFLITVGSLGGGGGEIRASFAQEMPVKLLYEVRPHQVEKSFKEPTYSADNDVVTAKEVYTYKNDLDIRQEVVIPVSQEQAVATFARALASDYVDIPQVAANRSFFNEGAITYDDLVSFYQNKLGTIASRNELERAIASGELDILLAGSKKLVTDGTAVPNENVTAHAQGHTHEPAIHQPPPLKKKNIIFRVFDKLSKILYSD